MVEVQESIEANLQYRLDTPTSKITNTELVASFIQETLDDDERRVLEDQLNAFVVSHACHHRPIVLVSSGGTAADLEIHSVRSLENFSSGTRGSISVENFLQKGYAVVHLWRQGSASPYGRILSSLAGISGSHGISSTALGKLIEGDAEEEDEDQLVRAVLREQEQVADPWLTDPSSATSATDSSFSSSKKDKKFSGEDNVELHRKIRHSTRLKQALKDRQLVMQEGRLLTIPFRSVEEYLGKLQICSVALKECQALAMIYLAAAVSDFYIPKDQRSEHKIQSGSTDDGSLTLKLHPVPKTMGLIRQKWAPEAFVCGFKLETDSAILRQKAERAIRKYGCHIVVGNLLETRYRQVWILAPPSYEDTEQLSVQDWPMTSITIASASQTSDNEDGLEGQLVDAVIQAHFAYISNSSSVDQAGAEAIQKAHMALERKKEEIKRAAMWKQLQSTALEWAGVAAGALISYLISSSLQKRM